jgi:hypothetical protein
LSYWCLIRVKTRHTRFRLQRNACRAFRQEPSSLLPPFGTSPSSTHDTARIGPTCAVIRRSPRTVGGMDLVGIVVAGCAPGDQDCAAGSVPPGIDTWFVVLVVVVLVTALVGASLLLRHLWSRGADAASDA